MPKSANLGDWLSAISNARTMWLAVGLTLLLAIARGPFITWITASRPLLPLEPIVGAGWFVGEFRAGATYPTTAPGILPPNLATAGSWLETDAWQGRAATGWFRVTGKQIHVAVAGYPRNEGCTLRAELRAEDGAITRLDCALGGPGELWRRWEISCPPGTRALRLVAEDRSTGLGGWFAFSQPFTVPASIVLPIYLHAQILAAATLAVALGWRLRLRWLAQRATAKVDHAPARWWAVSALGATAIAARFIFTATTESELLQRAPNMDISSLVALRRGLPWLTLLAAGWALIAPRLAARKTAAIASAFPPNDSTARRAVRRTILALATLAAVIGPPRFERDHADPLPVIESGASLGSGPFVPGGTHGGINMEEVPRGLATCGSWVSSGDFKGRHETGWFRAQPRITLMVCGYPKVNGNRLELEIRRRDGAHETIPFSDYYPGEKWQPWCVALSEEAEAMRVRAIDDSSGAVGWLAFSEPFVAQPNFPRQAWGIVRLLAATCLALTLLYGPGLLWFNFRARTLPEFAFAVLPGPLLLAALGLACWLVGGAIKPVIMARCGVIALLTWILFRCWSARFVWRVPDQVTALLGAGTLLVGFAVAKANFSVGPAGELFHHSISRSLVASGHPDSRISYHTVQLIGNHLAPFGPEATALLSPWSFSSRGPLAGLAAAPLVLATGGTPPRDAPGDVWQPFDRAGFAVYRITMIVLASLAAWAVFGVVAVFASATWGTIAAIVLLLTPFFVHELYFSWPKLIAAALVLVSFLLASSGRAFAAGAALGIGFLFHPLALLSSPFLALWLFGRTATGGGWRRLTPPVICALGVLVFFAPWQVLGRLAPTESARQSIFLHYFRMADNKSAPTLAQWGQSRWDNFANTFLPGYLFTGDPSHESVNSVYGPSDRWVRRSFAYWNTLPFALGLPAFLIIAAGIASACRRAPKIVAVTFAGPALFLIVYWGAASTGLMRHCGHVLFLSSVALGTWSIARWDTRWRRRAVALLLHPACFAWRAVEIGLVAFGTTFLNRGPRLQSPFGWNDLLSLAAAAACLTGSVVLLARTARTLRPTPFEPARARAAEEK